MSFIIIFGTLSFPVVNIPASHNNVPGYLERTQNAVRILKCNSIIKEYTTNFYSDGNLAHSGTGVMCDGGSTSDTTTEIIPLTTSIAEREKHRSGVCVYIPCLSVPSCIYSANHQGQHQRDQRTYRRYCPIKKFKVFPYSLPSVGPGADPGVQAVSPQVT